LFFLTAEKKKETIVDCWVFLHNKIMRETISKYVTYYDTYLYIYLNWIRVISLCLAQKTASFLFSLFLFIYC
jgi:hypothetical protein